MQSNNNHINQLLLWIFMCWSLCLSHTSIFFLNACFFLKASIICLACLAKTYLIKSFKIRCLCAAYYATYVLYSIIKVFKNKCFSDYVFSSVSLDFIDGCHMPSSWALCFVMISKGGSFKSFFMLTKYIEATSKSFYLSEGSAGLPLLELFSQGKL